jgi:type IV secretory pathway component VirB8
MAPGKRTIRASEIGSFLYCQRAWWYQRRKVQPINIDELAAGQDFHEQHIQQSRSANILRISAWLFLILAVIIIAVLIAAL